jgi:hypothetical protein
MTEWQFFFKISFEKHIHSTIVSQIKRKTKCPDVLPLTILKKLMT